MWDIIGTHYACFMPLITVDNATTLINVIGNHIEGRTNEDVQILDVRNDELLTHIPLGIERFFPNLMAFRWYNGSLTTISAEELRFPGLILLFMNQNRLISLDGRLLAQKPMLQWISFGYNLLEHVGHNFLSVLIDLHMVDFSNNPCIDKFVYLPEDIIELNRQLPIHCPPMLGECSSGCLSHVENLERIVFTETDDLRGIIAWQSEEISQLRNSVLGLEQQLRAIWPCVSCPTPYH